MDLVGCRRTNGAKPLSRPHPVTVLGTAPVTGALVIDVGVSDVRLLMDEPQTVLVDNLGRHDLRDSVAYAFEPKPPGCAEPDVSPGRIGVRNRANHCSVRWVIRIPRIDDVRVRVSVGDIELVAPVDRAIRLDVGVGSVHFLLDGRELQHDKAPGSGDQLRFGDLNTLPRLEARTGVGSIRAELKTRSTTRNER